MPEKPVMYLKSPDTTQKSLSFCAARERDLADWVSTLPKVNLAETGRRLYGALRELNQLKASPADRLALLNVLSASVIYAADGLFSRHLDSTYQLDDTERKVAGLAQALHMELAIGYKTVLHEANQGWAVMSKKDIMTRALNHCVWSLLPNLRRALSLYLPAPSGLWAELHQLYRIARKAELARIPVAWQGQNNTLEHGYLAALMLSTAQTFQLQKHEIDPVYRACIAWCSLTRLANAAQGGTYLLDMARDLPPQYIGEQTTLLPNALTVDTKQLVTRLQHQRDTLPAVPGMNDHLLDHLALAWHRAQPRRFRRQAASGAIQVTVGLSAVHQLLSGLQTFDSFITPYRGDQKNTNNERFAARATRHDLSNRDVWTDSFDAGLNVIPAIPMEDDDDRPLIDLEEVPEYAATLCDKSARGYCLQWADQAPKHLVTGELIAVRDERAKHRTIGLIRWTRQVPGKGLQLGVELLSPNAQSCAVRLRQKTGQHTDFMRGIILPEIKAIAQPESIILPRLAVRPGQKVMIYRKNTETHYRLSQKITDTSAVAQYTIEPMSAVVEKQTQANKNDWTMDPLWKSF